MTLGLRTKVIGAIVVFATVVGSAGALGLIVLQALEDEMITVYTEGVAPARTARAVALAYAVDVVDTTHKVCAGSLDPAAGVAKIEVARAASAAAWQELVHSPKARDLGIEEAADVRLVADRAAERARALMASGSMPELERFRTREMYPAIEPLSERVDRLVEDFVTALNAKMGEARGRLRWFRIGAIVMIAGVTLVALLAALSFSRRLLASILAVERVVRDVASGDLTRRIGPTGTDELARMAADIDRMVEALAATQHALEERSADLARAAQEARSANLAKSAFLSSMSHELRTPLNVILGYAQVMARDAGRTRPDRQALERILEAGEHLLGLITDVLSISRIEAGHVQINPRPLSPRALLASVEGLLGARARAKGLALRVEPDGSLPDSVAGDEGKVRQILVNLVGNAIKFTAAGEVRVTLAHEAGRLVGVVSDTGPGIPEAEQARLFETFFQGRAGLAAAEGAGLGLYISRSLARAMGGDLTLRSAAGVGSELRFDVEAPPVVAGAAAAPRHAPRLPAGVTVGPMLVVDDRASNREVLGRLLVDMGFTVDEVADGRAAVDACARAEHSLIWMDVRMPVLDGRAAQAAIQAAAAAAGRPPPKVVAITASVLDLDREEARRQGFLDVVGKPFRVADVVALVEEHLGVALEDAPAPEAEVPPATLDDVRAVPAELRSRLLYLLVTGDGDAARLAIAALDPPDLRARLSAEIEGWRHEPLIAALRAAQVV